MNQEQWARALLARLGIAATNGNVSAIMAWEQAEGGNWNNSAHYNPLNTTQGSPGAYSMNSVGVKAYTSWDQGLNATVQTLANGYYGGILSALRGDNAQSVARAIVSSPWGTKNISLSGITITGATASAADLASGSGGGSVTPTLDSGTLSSMYGLDAATLNANPELKRLFQQAVSGQWTADRFAASLKNTTWWRTTSDSARKFFMQMTGDPATFNATWTQAAMKANDIGVKLGIWNMASEGTSYGGKMDQLLRRATMHLTQDGWSDAQLTDWLGQYVRVNNGVMWGQAGENWDALHQYAWNNGMQYAWQWYYDQSRMIVSGQTTLEAAQAQIRHQAAAKYSAWSDQINAGQNVKDLAAPYTKVVSDLLELPDTQVDLSNKLVAQAMTAKTQTPLWQFENDVRSDPTWRKTNNARESTMQVAHQVAQNFGMAW